MSYDTVQLAAPGLISYWKIEELTTDGPCVDSFGGNNGTFYTSHSPILGIGGPIETDALSLGGKLRVCLVPVTSGDPLDLREQWSKSVWAYVDDLVFDHVQLCRQGSYGLNGSNLLGVNSGFASSRVSFGTGGANTYSLSAPDRLASGFWHRITETRNGSVLRIFVDGRLENERVDLPADPLVYAAYNDADWIIGASLPSGTSDDSDGTSHVAIANVAWSEAEELELYEAARNRLPMFVDINMRTYFIPDLTPPPVYAAFPYSHDFTAPAIERLIRLTEVVQAKDGTEERSGQSDKTRRRYTYDVPILDAHSRRRLKAFLRANQKQPVIWPITTDEDELSEAIEPGDSVVITVATPYLDYDVGGRAILGSETDYEAIEIVDMDAESITAKEVINDWPVGTIIRPAKLALVQQDLSLSSINEDTQDLSITATVLVEEIVASPNRITPYTPTLYRGVECFNPFEFGLNDTSEPSDDDVHMVSEVMDTGTGIFRVDTDQEFATEGIGYTFFLDGRELISQFLGWYEARAGRLMNLWVPTMVRDIGELVAISGSTITLGESYYETEYDGDPARSDLALIGYADVIGPRHINSVAPSGSNEVLTLSSAASPHTFSNTEFVCFLLMCRLDADEVELAWFTNDMLKATVKFREVPKEVV